jgi:hypothetical protein
MKGKLSKVLPLGAVLIGLGVAFLSFGCSSGNARFRFVQAATAVPINVDLQIDGKSIQTNIGFGQSATYRSVGSGSHKFALFGTGTTTNPYLNTSASLTSGDNTVIVQGQFSGASISSVNGAAQPLVLADTNTTPTTGNASLRIINVAPTVGPIDVYVVQQGSGIAGQNPQLVSLAYADPIAYKYLPEVAGSYDVDVTVSGTQNIIANFTVILTSEQIRTLLILDSQIGGGPYSLTELNDLN